MKQNRTVLWWMGCFRYDDSKIWQRTSLYPEESKKKLEDHLGAMTYVDKTTITIVPITLPQ